MNKDQSKSSSNEEKKKSREVADKVTDDKNAGNRTKSGKNAGKDETVLAKINGDARKDKK